MSNQMAAVPKITKMAKYVQALTANREKLRPTHHRVLHILREMNTTVQIISGLTGLDVDKVRTAVNELAAMGLASVTETRKSKSRPSKVWGVHDEFRSIHTRTYPSAEQVAVVEEANRKGGRALEMDELATLLWANPETGGRGRSGALVEVALNLKAYPLSSQQAGEKAARREAAQAEVVPESWDPMDFVEDQD